MPSVCVWGGGVGCVVENHCGGIVHGGSVLFRFLCTHCILSTGF